MGFTRHEWIVLGVCLAFAVITIVVFLSLGIIILRRRAAQRKGHDRKSHTSSRQEMKPAKLR